VNNFTGNRTYYTGYSGEIGGSIPKTFYNAEIAMGGIKDYGFTKLD
jgi:hypothetical protein